MTCACCGRDVALVDGFACSLCYADLTQCIDSAIDSSGWLDGDVVDVFKHEDGYVHLRLEVD